MYFCLEENCRFQKTRLIFKNNMTTENILDDLYATEKLFDLIHKGNELTETLLQEGADIDAQHPYGYTPLLYAALRAKKSAIEVLIKWGADVDYCNGVGGYSVLYVASGNGWLEIVQSLVKKVSDLDSRDDIGETALHNAAYFGNTDVAKCLVEAGADINAKGKRRVTPLLYAAAFYHKDVFELLLDAGANVNDCDSHGRSVLYYAARNENEWIDIVKTLVKRVPDLINKRARNEMTPLHMAALSGNWRIVRCLVKEGADIDARNNKGATPLMYAARRGHKNVIDLLLHAGANVDLCDDKSNTVLHIVSQFNHVDIALTLLMREEKPVDINARNHRGKTALLLACQFGNLNNVEYLFQTNAHREIADIDGKPPLHYLIKMKRPSVELIKLFIEDVAVLQPCDYDAMLNNSLLKKNILQDVEFCFKAIINKFNNHDLTKLYNSPVAGRLPQIEKMKMVSCNNTFQGIERAVRFEIQTIGHCTQLKDHPNTLKVLCVKSILEYYDKTNQICKIG